MATNPLPATDDNQGEYNPQLEAEDEALSSGNTRLGLIVGALFLLGIGAYALVPKPEGGVLASVTPSFLLEAAAVTATRQAPAAAPDAPATAVSAAPDAPGRPKPTAATAATAAAAAVVSARPATPAAAMEVVAPAPAPEVVAPAPEPVAPVAEAAKPSTVTVSGRILDENGRPLAGATVLLKGSSKGAGTDANGNYSIEIPAGDHVLSIGYGGYRDEEVRTRDGKPVNITLVPTPGVKRRRN